jgi:hypothetical protein
VDQSVAQVKAEALIGAGLVTTPVWAIFLQDVSLIASTIAAVTGAIIGLHAVWRLVQRRRAAP